MRCPTLNRAHNTDRAAAERDDVALACTSSLPAALTQQIVMLFRQVLEEARKASDTVYAETVSAHIVPSVGIEPPTPRPSPKKQAHSRKNDGAKQAQIPKTLVRSSVPLKGVMRPNESESVNC